MLIQGQGQGSAYKLSYTQSGKDFLNTFSQTEFGKSYWVKVNSQIEIEYITDKYYGIKYITLAAGWNFVGSPYALTLEEIKTQVGESNLLVIQGATQGSTYKKSYVDDGKSFLNSFTEFTESQGYWVKLTTASELKYLFELESMAKDNAYNDATLSQLINGQSYAVSVYANSNPVDETSQDTLPVYGTVNGTQMVIALNNSYRTNTIFQVKVTDGSGAIVATSDFLNKDTYIDFGALTVESTELTIEAKDNAYNDINITKSIDDTNYNVVLYASKLPKDETSQNTISVYGNVNGTQVLMEINNSYLTDTAFQVKVYNTLGELVGMSSIVNYDATAIDFGDVTLN